MPFVNAEHRAKPSLKVPGDRCYLQYKRMMDLWRKEPRWRTVDDIYSSLITNEDTRAYFLAFLVFFVKEVMPYELAKEKENGSI